MFESRSWNDFFANEVSEANQYLESMPGLIAHSPSFRVVRAQHSARRAVAAALCGRITDRAQADALLDALAQSPPDAAPEPESRADFERFAREYVDHYRRRLRGDSWV